MNHGMLRSTGWIRH